MPQTIFTLKIDEWGSCEPEALVPLAEECRRGVIRACLIGLSTQSLLWDIDMYSLLSDGEKSHLAGRLRGEGIQP